MPEKIRFLGSHKGLLLLCLLLLVLAMISIDSARQGRGLRRGRIGRFGRLRSLVKKGRSGRKRKGPNILVRSNLDKIKSAVVKSLNRGGRKHYVKKQYNKDIEKIMVERSYEDFAKVWMKKILELEGNISLQIFHPIDNQGEILCNNINLLNLELEKVLIPLKKHDDRIVYIARKIFVRRGPQFIFELLPDNKRIKLTFDWNDYQLSRFYRLWMETRLIWEEFKEAYFFMQISCPELDF